MRIISGTYKGKRLTAPKKLPVRPTTDMAKEALFNILNNRFYFEELKVLDLFSGTGNISYEFASRGVETSQQLMVFKDAFVTFQKRHKSWGFPSARSNRMYSNTCRAVRINSTLFLPTRPMILKPNNFWKSPISSLKKNYYWKMAF